MEAGSYDQLNHRLDQEEGLAWPDLDHPTVPLSLEGQLEQLKKKEELLISVSASLLRPGSLRKSISLALKSILPYCKARKGFVYLSVFPGASATGDFALLGLAQEDSSFRPPRKLSPPLGLEDDMMELFSQKQIFVRNPNLRAESQLLTDMLESSFDYEALLLLPLHHRENMIGFLALDVPAIFLHHVDQKFLQLFAGHFLTNAIQTRSDELQLRQTHGLNQRIINSTQSIIFILNGDGSFALISNQIQRILGYAPNEINASTFFTLLSAQNKTHLLRSYLWVRRKGQTKQIECRIKRADGKVIIMRVTLSPLQGIRLRGRVLGVAEDISEVKNKGLQLIHAGKLVTLGELAGGLAHEINQPLNAMRLSVEILKSDLENDRIDLPFFLERLESIDQMIERTRLILEKLQLFRSRGGTFKQNTSANEIINGSLDILQGRLRKYPITVKTALQEDLPPIYADANAMQQVFINLLINAIEAIESGSVIPAARDANTDLPHTDFQAQKKPGIITIKSKLLNPQLIELAISDNGIGIDPETQSNIFDPFFTTKGVGQGTGLGLSASYGIIKEHGGAIAVDSQPGLTTFHITIPISKNKTGES